MLAAVRTFNRSITKPTTQAFSFSTSKAPSILPSSLQRWLQNMPKGFRNFFPKGAREGKGKDQLKDSLRNFGKRSNNKGNRGNPNEGDGSGNNLPNPSSWLLPAALAFPLLFMMLNDGQGAQEISLQELVRSLLPRGDIQRIEVNPDSGEAMIYIKRGSGGTIRQQMSDDQRREQQQQDEHSFGDETLDASERFRMNAEERERESIQGFSSTSSSSSSSSPSFLKTTDVALRSGPRYKVMVGSIDAFERRLEEEQRILSIPSSEFVPIVYKREMDLGKTFMQFLPTIIFLGILFSLRKSMMGGLGGLGGGGKGGGPGGMFGVGKSTHKKVTKEDVSVSFKDVAGVDNAKKEIMEFVQFLQNPSKFSKLGAKIPKGALLCGPPGTGKTLLAKAVAGEASVPFFSISGSDFLEMFVGVGPSRVRDLFREARENAPCIVWIDEIDAVGRKRGKGGFSGSNDERENTLNQMLVEMDGFDERTSVVVLAGTNRQDILDEALLRPGRFDRQITVSKPDLKGRKDIFKVHLKPLTLRDDPNDIAGRLAGLTPGFSGADIQNVCNEAAIFAARGSKDKVDEEDFESAIDRVIGGLEAPKIMTPDEKRRVAFHEAGHAIAGWFLEHSDPLLKVTIIPRSSGALGFAQYLPKELSLRTKEQIDDIVTMALGGRAAEEIIFGSVTTGAQDDLRKVSNIIYSTIKDFGMSPVIGNLAFPTEPNAYGQVERNYSESTAELIDQEAKKEVNRLYERTLQLLRERKVEMTKIAELLLEKETITHDDIISLIGERPYPGSEEYQQFVSRKKAMKEEMEGAAEASKDGEKKQAKKEKEEEEEDDENQWQPAM